eukprot:m51a1_g2018 hypothetical protein (648) ;mRNA; r:1279624-1281633
MRPTAATQQPTRFPMLLSPPLASRERSQSQCARPALQRSFGCAYLAPPSRSPSPGAEPPARAASPEEAAGRDSRSLLRVPGRGRSLSAGSRDELSSDANDSTREVQALHEQYSSSSSASGASLDVAPAPAPARRRPVVLPPPSRPGSPTSHGGEHWDAPLTLYCPLAETYAAPRASHLLCEEPLPEPAAQGRNCNERSEAERELELRARLRIDELPCGLAGRVFGLASVRGLSPRTPEQLRESRPGIDLFLVLDTSGSMSGTKMALLGDTVSHLVSQLSARDRLSVVTFSAYPRVVCNMRCVSEGAAAELSQSIAGALVAQGGTCLSAALTTALDLVNARAQRNSVCAVLLLTDGCDTVSQPADVDRMCAALRAVRASGACAVHTFGYGPDHDSNTCAEIARLGAGVFTYVPDNENVGPAFASVLGGLMSVCAQRLVLTVRPCEGASIEAVRTYFETTTLPSGAVQVAIPDMFEGERRDTVIDFAVFKTEAPLAEQRVAEVELAYSQPGREGTRTVRATFAMQRPAEIAKQVAANFEVEAHAVRYEVADALGKVQELAGKRDFIRALSILCRYITYVEQLPKSNLVDALLHDLRECQRRMSLIKWDSDGMAMVAAARQEQYQQRSWSVTSFFSTRQMHIMAETFHSA